MDDNTNQDDGLTLPASLVQTEGKTTEQLVNENKAREQAGPTMPATKPATEASTSGEQTTTPQTKPSRKERRKAAKEARKATKHQPSTIVRTEGNPAKSIVPVRFKAKYAEHGGDCGDALAGAVRAFIYTRNDDGREVLNMANLYKLAEANDIDPTAYKKLNNGQQSMNIRNRLRGLLKAGKKVVIPGGRTFADKDKALAMRPSDKPKAKKGGKKPEAPAEVPAQA